MLKKIKMHSVEETHQLGHLIAAHIESPFFIALSGNLGTGKTELSRSIIQSFGIKTVKSPSFTIMKQYEAGFPIYHIDAYRLSDPQELIDIGFNDLLDENALILLEWPENVKDILPENRLNISISGNGDEDRMFQIESSGKKYDHFICELEL